MARLHADRGENPRSIRPIAERAVSRAAGAPLVAGNGVRLLLDAKENYGTWREAIGQAKQASFSKLHHQPGCHRPQLSVTPLPPKPRRA